MSLERWQLGGTTVSLVAATETATVLELVLVPGAGAGPHTHTREDETVVVLEGSLVVDDGEPRTLSAGEGHVLARGARHSFVNAGETAARALFFCAPGGLERFFREVAAAESEPEAEAAAERAGLTFD